MPTQQGSATLPTITAGGMQPGTNPTNQWDSKPLDTSALQLQQAADAAAQSKAAQPANLIPVIDPQGNPYRIDANKMDAAMAKGYRPAVNVVGPDGNTFWLDKAKLPAARRQNFALVPNSDYIRTITPKGQEAYILPDEIEQARAAGHLILDSHGVPMPSPAESNAADNRMAALAGMTNIPTPNMSPDQRAQFKRGQDAGYISGVATVPAVVGGAAALAPTSVPVAGGMGFGGAGASSTFGPSLASQAIRTAAPYAAKLLVHGAGAGAVGYTGIELLKKFLAGGK